MKDNNSSFSLIQRISFYVLAGFWLVLGILVFFIYGRVSDSFEGQMRDSLGREMDKFHGQIAQEAEGAFEQAMLVSRDAGVLEAYEVALADGLVDDEAHAAYGLGRARLQAALSGMVSAHGEFGNGRLAYHFHLPNVRSLWRVWRSGQETSDDLSGFRATVAEVNAVPHRPVKGIEVGRGGFAIRGLAPIASGSGEHLGSVEYLGSFGAVFDSLTENTELEAAVYMDAALLSVATSLRDPVEHPVIGGEHVLVNASDAGLFDRVATADLLGSVEEDRIVDAETHMLGLSSILDFGGEPVGTLVLAFPKEELLALQRNLLWLLVGAFFLSTVLVGGILYVIYRPLSQVTRISGELAQSAGNIREASGEVAGSSHSLAEGASEQAASLEESSAALEKVSDMIRQDAGLAKSTNETAEAANASVGKGEAAMGSLRDRVEAVSQSSEEMQAAMTAIQESSDSISRIIKNIDEIAFQTNVLALNAAVEAARAGEAGSGFAVVAEEVRSLAARAAEAARETTGIIEDSRERARRGMEVNAQVSEHLREVVEHVGAVESELKDITSGVREVGQSMQRLEGSVTEQSGSINEINTAVTQVNEVTQANAASAEEAASAAEELNAQSRVLNDLSVNLAVLIEGSRRAKRQNLLRSDEEEQR